MSVWTFFKVSFDKMGESARGKTPDINGYFNGMLFQKGKKIGPGFDCSSLRYK